ncbi:hypothetical protein [Streptomyces sp. NPDC002054]|uniref:hypothetical protein n=1 Tax=Streptomyces sp. NPDC002054 TaxID=3154663 RepID=UPI0033205326
MIDLTDLVDLRFEELPELTGVRLRSVRMDGWAPTVTLRIDLPSLAGRWEAGPGETVQCHLQFGHVADFEMEGWRPPATVDFSFEELPDHRLAVRVAGPGVRVAFTSNASPLAGHLSVFAQDAEGGDGGPHAFVRKLDVRLYDTVPPVTARTFYEHL